MTKTLAKQLTQIIENSLHEFKSITQEDWEVKPAPNKWCKKEILGHLIDSSLNNIHRFVRIKHGDETNIWYQQDAWVEANDYQHQDLESLKNLWRAVNLQIARVWAKTWETDLEKTIPVKDETPTFKFLMEDYIDHMNHHLRQII